MSGLITRPSRRSAPPAATVWPLRVLTVESPSGTFSESTAAFRHAGIELTALADGAAALAAIGTAKPAAVLVPTDLADIELLRFVDLVTTWTAVPVLVGLARNSEAAELAYQALEHGARAIVGLPCTAAQLGTSVQECGLAPTPQEREVSIGGLRLDPAAHRIWVGTGTVTVTPKEFQVLEYLMRNAPRVVTPDELLSEHGAYGNGSIGGLRATMARLRHKLIDAGPDVEPTIETVRGLGYRLAS